MITLKTLAGRSVIGALVAATAAFAASTSTSSAAPTGLLRYDGTWSVSVVTEKGTCDRGYRYPIRISNGTLINAGSNPFTISGKVAPTGAIVVTVSAGSKSATGHGRLAGNIGAGLWSGGDCSGSWTAERRNPNDVDSD